MKHKLFFTAAAVIMLLQMFIASYVWANGITIDWRQKLDSGNVDDLHFMPGQEQFILSSGQIQKFTEIRSCEDGSIIKYYPFGGYQFEFTPDSTKLIFMSGLSSERGKLELRNLNDMNIISQYQLPKDEELPYSYFVQMAVDPVRPFIYVIWTRTNNSPTNGITKRKILIYNRETLQPTGELTTDADSSLYFVNIAVSKDGKYLAAMNAYESKLIVWSLDTRKKVVDTYISDQNSDKFSEPAHIKFSELNTDKIYFTGEFYKENNDVFAGLCIFSISENRIIDSTFALPPNRYGWNPEICLFENESKVIGTSDGFVKVLDLSSAKVEINKDITSLDGIAAYSNIFNDKFHYFIGISGNGLNKFNYQTSASVPTNKLYEVIYPNPTTGILNIPLTCTNAGRYEIYNSAGRIINSSNLTGVTGNLLTLDFTQYPSGIYSVKVYCGAAYLSYEILKN